MKDDRIVPLRCRLGIHSFRTSKAHARKLGCRERWCAGCQRPKGLR